MPNPPAVRFPAVLFYVQHLLGTGHVHRASRLVRAMTAAGWPVTVVFGGRPIDGIDFGGARLAHLPPIRSVPPAARPLVDGHGHPVDDRLWGRRREALVALADRVRPDIVVTEMFPFGRRPFRRELLPLLDRLQARAPAPVIACSVRDILVGKDKPERNAEMADLAARYYDLVLVHGDPAVIPFDRTFPMADRIEDRLIYTGYIAPPDDAPEAPPGEGEGEVIVSVGGGAVGEGLLRAAIAARPLSAAADRVWRLLVGGDLADAVLHDLRRTAPSGVIVERARPDFLSLLSRCHLSVSQAGYNTVMDLARAGCRSVLVPFSEGGESEQTVRARLLADRGFAATVAAQAVSEDPRVLAEAVTAVTAGPPPPSLDLRMDGAAASLAALAAACRHRRFPPGVATASPAWL